MKLSKIDEKHFRIPYYSNEPIKQLKSCLYFIIISFNFNISEPFKLLNSNFIYLNLVVNIPKKTSLAVPMMVYQTEPSFKLDKSQLGSEFDHNAESAKLLESLSDYLNIAEEVKQDVAGSLSEVKNIPGKDVIITTLGTGSTLPSKYRNGKFFHFLLE